MQPNQEEEALVAELNVSRETFLKLQAYVDLLLENNKIHNLISRKDAEQVWRRHIIDSAQLIKFIPDKKMPVADIGSGAGLPGIVLAILGCPVTMIESVGKKARFIETVVGALSLSSIVVSGRAEIHRKKYPIITSRAVANLDRLFGLVSHMTEKNTRLILPKGRNAEQEIADARAHWVFDTETHPSITGDGRIVIVRDLCSKPKSSLS